MRGPSRTSHWDRSEMLLQPFAYFRDTLGTNLASFFNRLRFVKNQEEVAFNESPRIQAISRI